MNPATLAFAAATLFFSKLLKEGGKAFGQGTAVLATHLPQNKNAMAKIQNASSKSGGKTLN
ncbi:hypothetical protein [Phormidium tenue]|uniref:hypothetical protein n=1 Tax=Phormidium tenue TaxID=126344 RepID=UPI00111516FA|nr:hypothetical protein [Phormidium tenue]MBD2234979.1 hypothetical protein [Phormidium tenue FACHB-1052]